MQDDLPLDLPEHLPDPLLEPLLEPLLPQLLFFLELFLPQPPLTLNISYRFNTRMAFLKSKRRRSPRLRYGPSTFWTDIQNVAVAR